MAGNPNILPGYPTDPRVGIKYSLARYRSANIYQNITTLDTGYYDYGLPTDIYTIRVFMRGYIQALPPAISIDELDQPVTVNLGTGSCVLEVSIHMYRGGGINATARSIDWQRPPVERNWVWNNAAVNFLVYDISSLKFVDVINFWDTYLNEGYGGWIIPAQDAMFTTLPWGISANWLGAFTGPPADNPFPSLPYEASFIMTNGSVQVDRFGPDFPNSHMGSCTTPVIMGTCTPTPSISGGAAAADASSDPGQTRVTFDFVQKNLHEGFLYNFSSYRLPIVSLNGLPSFRSNLAIYPGTYALSGWTYGYVQDNVIDLVPGVDLGNVYVAVSRLGQMADINIRLIIGVNLTLTMIFKTENIISGTPYNSSVRIRVFDDVDRLVAATTLINSDAGALVPSPPYAGFFTNGTKNLKIMNEAVPAGTTILTYRNLAGSFDYVDPASPIAGIRAVTLFSGDHGIWGRSARPGGYSGNWTVMVDFVNWSNPALNYPPVPGLLQGESPYFFPYNHLGPYLEKKWIKISNAPLTGEASAIFELDLRGYVRSTILGMNWDDAARTLSWTTLQIVDSSSYQYYWYTWDGFVDGYLDPGTYHATISVWNNNVGYIPIKFVLQVSPGQQASLNYILNESGIPIPKFSGIPLALNSLTLSLTACLPNSSLYHKET
jgi:hypothetical protein